MKVVKRGTAKRDKNDFYKYIFIKSGEDEYSMYREMEKKPTTRIIVKPTQSGETLLMTHRIGYEVINNKQIPFLVLNRSFEFAVFTRTTKSYSFSCHIYL